jgi:hypothetical protein
LSAFRALGVNVTWADGSDVAAAVALARAVRVHPSIRGMRGRLGVVAQAFPTCTPPPRRVTMRGASRPPIRADLRHPSARPACGCRDAHNCPLQRRTRRSSSAPPRRARGTTARTSSSPAMPTRSSPRSERRRGARSSCSRCGAHEPTRTPEHAHTHARTYARTRSDAHAHARAHVHARARPDARTHARTHALVLMRMHAHARRHRRTRGRSLCSPCRTHTGAGAPSAAD